MQTPSRLTVIGMSTKDDPTLGMLRRSGDRAFVANGAAVRRAAARPRIVIVDDHPITLAGLNFLLATDCTVLARCADAHEALRCVRIYEPDVLIIDQDMPAMDGVDVLKQLRAAGDQTPVVLLATANTSKLMEALAFKVEGVVFKQSDPKRLIRCVREVHAGQRWLDAKLNEAAAVASGGDALDTLTRRQIEVARAAVSGLSNKELAQRLGVSEGTIKNHLHAIYERLRLEGRLSLLLYLKEKAGA
jgi:two-component system, NarL family, nitrate/nitrite response regulator NarL